MGVEIPALINNIDCKSRRSIDWNEIKTFLKQYEGERVEMLEEIYTGMDFLDEYTHFKDKKL